MNPLLEASEGWVAAAMVLAVGTSVVGAALMKASHGLRRPGPVVGMVVSYGLGITLLTLLADRMPIGIVYAVWAGGATVATALLGRLVLRESISALQGAGIGLIASGVLLVTL